MRGGCEGIQFPSSRGWRAAHTLPFGAVTPRELWSPNEWLGRAKRRITYFFFFFSRSCTLFQDVYKYENRTRLPTLTTRRRPRSLSSLWMLLAASGTFRTGRSATRRHSISGNLQIAPSGSTDYETYLSECVFCRLKGDSRRFPSIFSRRRSGDDYQKFLCVIVSSSPQGGESEMKRIAKISTLLSVDFCILNFCCMST